MTGGTFGSATSIFCGVAGSALWMCTTVTCCRLNVLASATRPELHEALAQRRVDLVVEDVRHVPGQAIDQARRSPCARGTRV